jgi:hypothetical protein
MRLFLPVKNNLAKSNGLSFSVVDGRCVWNSEEVLLSADEIGSEEDTPREEAKRWLEAKLSQPMPAKWILTQAKSDGISERTLHRAKKELKITSERQADSWIWQLPGHEQSQDGAGVFIVQ